MPPDFESENAKIPFLELVIFLPEPTALPLSSPQPEFKDGGYTFNDCLLLHRLLVTGHGDEVERRRQELSPSLLSHTCQYDFLGSTFNKVILGVKLIEVQVSVHIKDKYKM